MEQGIPVETVGPMDQDIHQTQQHIATHESTTVVQASDGEIYHYVIPAEGGHVMPLDNSGAQNNATQYYDGEELIASALTDEDRKLAAALVDVHYKNQQHSHQSVITNSLETTTTQYTVDTTAGSESAVAGEYMEQETVEETVAPEVLGHNDEAAEYISKTLENMQNESTEQNEDDQASEEANSENPSHIVYKSSGKATQEEQQATPGKKSLPHKKRMAAANKLNEDNEAAEEAEDSPGKNFFSCSKCGDLFTTQQELASHKKKIHSSKTKATVKAEQAFLCQLCQDSFSSQMEFFEHLKSHYEPQAPKAEEDTMSADGDNGDQDDDESDGDEPIVKTVYLTENTMDGSDFGGKENKPKTGKKKNKPSGKTQFPGFTIVKAEARTFSCTKCSKSFRKLTALETHIATTHPKKEEMEEFSEPEDMMEGLRHVVNILPNEGGEDDKSNIVVRSWSPLGTTLLDQGQGHNYNMSSHHYTEVLDPNMTAQQYENFDSINVELGGGKSTDKTISVTLVPIHEASTENDIIAASSSDDWKGTVVLLEDDEPKKPKRPKKEKVPGEEKYVRRKKDEKMPLVCEYCSREFKHKNTLVYHLRSHTGEKPHMCDVCGKGFFTASALKVHNRIHLGQRPYPCELCGRAFRQWGDLKYHKLSLHTEIKGFQCEYCGKEFARKYSLVVHRRIHTGERNYQCEFCNKAFRASSYLQNHRRIHTGEKPHFCPVCNKLFRVRSDMKRHLNTHNVDPQDYLTVTGNQTGAIVKREDVVTVEGTYVEEYQTQEVEQVHRRRGGGKKGRPARSTRAPSPLSSDSSDTRDMLEVPSPEPAPKVRRRGVHHEPIEVDYANNKEMYVWIPDN